MRIHFDAYNSPMDYPNSSMGYANPDAVTQIATGLSTTTFTYDNNGNVTQKTLDGTTTTYVYDYANRIHGEFVSSRTNGAVRAVL